MLNDLTIGNMESDEDGKTGGANTLKSVLVIIYGITSYLIGVTGLLVLILAMANLFPLGGMLVFTSHPIIAVAINILLVLLFGLQHSVMARPAFKAKLKKYLPAALERSTFVWSSGVVMAITVVAWQPLDGTVWQANGKLNVLLWAGFVFGWSYLLAATFAINHWDLFGLRQTWLQAKGVQYSNVVFKESWMYRYSRHPIMLGALIGVWCVPVMTMSMLMLSIGLTLYIAIGLYYEERDLIKHWGQSYLDYKKRVRTFF